MATEHYIIIGNGAAANAAADVLRTHDSESQITLISDEFFPFYYRHCLREYIVGAREEERLLVRPPSHYKDQRIRLRLGQKVVKVDLQAHTLYLEHMEKLHFDKLFLCVGSKPRIPEAYNDCREHFTVMNTLTHARRLRQLLPQVEHVVVAGGDMVSCRIASTLRANGKEVTFLIDRDSFWPLELTPERRADLAPSLADKGIGLVDDVLQGVQRTDTGYTVRTRGGTTIPCDLVAAFFGLVPNVDFLVGCGLDIDRGVLVDEFLRTNVPDVYAAGDCAQVYNPQIRNYWVSVGWPNAQRLGEIAANNLLGRSAQVDLPRTSVLTYDKIKVQTAWWREF